MPLASGQTLSFYEFLGPLRVGRWARCTARATRPSGGLAALRPPSYGRRGKVARSPVAKLYATLSMFLFPGQGLAFSRGRIRLRHR